MNNKNERNSRIAPLNDLLSKTQLSKLKSPQEGCTFHVGNY